LKSIMLIGLALIILGIGARVYQGVTYTTRTNIIDLGPIVASVDTQKNIPLSHVLGGLTLVSGIALVIIGRKKP